MIELFLIDLSRKEINSNLGTHMRVYAICTYIPMIAHEIVRKIDVSSKRIKKLDVNMPGPRKHPDAREALSKLIQKSVTNENNYE